MSPLPARGSWSLAAVALIAALVLLTGCGGSPSRTTTTTSPSPTPTRPVPAPGGTAAIARSWGAPSWSDEFSGSSVGRAWGRYDGPGNDDNGLRRPSQVAVAGGLLTETGTREATSGGMALRGHDALTGRWEVRARADQGAGPGAAYRAVVALIPADVPYASGARDLDLLLADVGSPTTNFFLHYPPGKQDYAETTVDLTGWHTFGVEIAPDHVTWFVDGNPTVTDLDRAALPTTPMTLGVQLDATAPNGMIPARFQLDWARYYPLPAGTVPVPDAPAPQTGVYDPSS